MEKEDDIVKELQIHIIKAKESFPYFIEHIFPLSFKKTQIKRAPHTFNWAKITQQNKRTAILSSRKHLKSTTIYAFIMWSIFKLEETTNERWLYMSYNQKMSMYHTENIKQLIKANPLFNGIIDNTLGNSSLDYSWKEDDRFICSPNGILTFNRGWHGEGVICDDILQDPTTPLNLTIISKINRIFMEQVMSLPKEGGQIHLVGTAQHAQDLFFQLKDNPSWNWGEYKAILNEKEKKTLWPELFSYERLVDIRINELGEKAFSKEYMCSPVWSEDAYFKRTELLSIVSKDLKMEKNPAKHWKSGEIIAGLDIGKKAHPSHVAIFNKQNGQYTMLFEKFLDGWDYTKQIEFLKGLKEFYLIDEIRYDNTRGEFEPFMEQRIIDPRIWKPVVFGTQTKFQMASNFSRCVSNKTIKLLNSQRMVDSVLSVSNDLKAPETNIGHGDAFWSISLALYSPVIGGGYISL